VIALPIHWPGEWRQALSDAALQQASSATIFQRAKAYVASGAVEVVGEDPMPEPALRGEVAGTDTYTTEVWIEDDAVAGACDCPHAEEGWFCKPPPNAPAPLKTNARPCTAFFTASPPPH